MQNKHSNRSKYVLAARLGAAAGGLGVALRTRVVPKLMSGMEEKCKQMMAGMAASGCPAGDTCKPTVEKTGPAAEHASCEF